MGMQRGVLTWALALSLGSTAWAQSQGVSQHELTLGTIQDLSGPIAGLGKQVRNGMLLRIDEINEQGGVHGRKLVLKVEDSGYDPKRAVLAAQKLVNQDKIFAMVGHIGTAQNVATFPVLFKKNVISYYPLSAGREMFEPLNRLKFGFVAPYYDQIRQATPQVAKQAGAQKVCSIYQDDEYGLEVVRGAEAGLQESGMAMTEKTSFKRGATDFSSQVAKMKASGCDMVVLGTIIRETVGTIAEARKNGFNPVFLTSQAGYSELIHKLGGSAMDGLYATMTAEIPYLDAESQPLRFWANKYKTRFDEDPGVFSVSGYLVIDTFAKAAQAAGPQLSTDSLIAALDKMGFEADFFGAPEQSFTATRRLASTAWRLSQIQDGRWKVVRDY